MATKTSVNYNNNYVNESDPRSTVHYLGSSENKAWKKFRPVRDLNPYLCDTGAALYQLS